MKKITTLLSIILVITRVSLAQSGVNRENIRKVILENGLTVILDENHSQPEVFGMVVVKAGGKNDPEDATGMAHYQEHMLFKGTTELGTVDWEKEKPHIDRIFALYDSLGKTTDKEIRSEIQKKINDESVKANQYAIPNEFSNLVKQMGGTMLNAGTSPDYTVFYNKFPSNQIERWIDLYAHRFNNPVFRGFQAELEVVYEEKNLYNDQFQTKLLEEFQKHFFKNHPYGQQTLIGTIEDLKNPSLTKMYRFFKTYYVPNNMALILSGDFDSETVIPIIRRHFGQWKRKTLPKKRTWAEAPFNGREFHQAKLTPIKIALLGYRAPSVKDRDAIYVDIITRMLNNSNSTGLLDQLSLEGKLLISEAFNLPYHDHGSIAIFAVPKIIGQSLEKAESLIHEQLDKLKKGEFDSSLLEAVKLELYRSYTTRMERISSRAMLLSNAFVEEKTIDDVLQYPNRIKQITKSEVVAVANRIFGPNFLAFYSKMGFPKKKKISKPDYEPLKASANGESIYAKHFRAIPVSTPRIKPINFETDLEQATLKGNHTLYRVANPYNDIFGLTIRMDVGKATIPMLKFASNGMAVCGAGPYSVLLLKKELAKIGATLDVYSNDHETTVEITGLEKHLPRAMELAGLLMKAPKLEQAKVKTIISEEKTNRKLERSEPDNVADALLQYGLYGKQSDYLNRLSKRQLKRLRANAITEAFKEATSYHTTLFFTGKTPLAKLTRLVKQNIPLSDTPKTDNTPADRPLKQYAENTILLVNKPKARQSKIFVYLKGKPFSVDDAVNIEAFNQYFGGGFSGLVLQEIREHRSLAYSAGANFGLPNKQGNPTRFIGYIGTQSDKTLEALNVFDSLVREMPQKPERTEMIKRYLTLSAQTNRPSFREIAQSVERWKKLGYQSDPALLKLPAYQSLTWNTIWTYYNREVKPKPIVYMIVGDTGQFDPNKLKRFGKVIAIKEKKLFTK